MESGRYQEAIVLFEKAVEEKPFCLNMFYPA